METADRSHYPPLVTIQVSRRPSVRANLCPRHTFLRPIYKNPFLLSSPGHSLKEGHAARGPRAQSHDSALWARAAACWLLPSQLSFFVKGSPSLLTTGSNAQTEASRAPHLQLGAPVT